MQVTICESYLHEDLVKIFKASLSSEAALELNFGTLDQIRLLRLPVTLSEIDLDQLDRDQIREYLHAILPTGFDQLREAIEEACNQDKRSEELLEDKLLNKLWDDYQEIFNKAIIKKITRKASVDNLSCFLEEHIKLVTYEKGQGGGSDYSKLTDKMDELAAVAREARGEVHPTVKNGCLVGPAQK
jgi:hypothetical protein